MLLSTEEHTFVHSMTFTLPWLQTKDGGLSHRAHTSCYLGDSLLGPKKFMLYTLVVYDNRCKW